MTNEYKLAPIVPTDEMITAYLQPRRKGTLKQFVTEQYGAMIKDAPTLVEVDLEEKQFYFKDGRLDVVASQYYNMAISDIQKKHGKIYAVKGE